MIKKIANWPEHERADPADWIRAVLTWGQTQKVTDFYFLPAEGSDYQVRGQISGQVRTLAVMEADFGKRALAVIKYRAGLNLAESRRPQLGRFDFGQGFVRVSTVGDFLGQESAVLRLIYPDLSKNHWFEPAIFVDLVAEKISAGLYLVAGPTGSGKTSTLYRLLEAWSPGKVVLTVEDPVEIYQPAFLQLQVNEQAGIDYQSLIKVALRHRPDLLVIGEIRDTKTAQAALQAALAGHLVLSTLHANSEIAVFDRLLNLGLDRQLLNQALVKTVYQRLLPGLDGQLGVVCGVANWQAGEVIQHRPYAESLKRYRQGNQEV
ncbi:ATPase, T2SS/T4P/T4SS family [Fructobacillus evanidus]|uniref:ATPase, T2SS/T4P/T4SS family n=1 Tax=Fructobacillus evanidus TaxID=3064281 RepID=UPI002D8CC804|nr:Type II secretory pathway ATPase GspE/PulE or T4P pilus assembly pathway ATPase PilB (PulE) [Fructobacillus sp. LMG 32999]CAK1239673.1 Type II secretory pathway ATPase GspE/PulE or T4P pilus assembly pathway ATPase PilB (PulE) [Fructobacillus sp. LMG 32999]CAK1241037.1 Type II secretory pathway ATPase GspE/PulE or T4P pilus assembly pathway ATPase PilB (PulE) [Fructobacillus sp. LMG 32999]